MPQGWDSYTKVTKMGFGKDGKGSIVREFRTQALGALASNAGILIGTKLGLLERFRVLKYELWAALTGLTSGEGTGLIIGIADGDFTLVEIEGALESNGPLGPNDTVIAAAVERFVILLGAVDRETGTEAIFENNTGGHMMEKNLRWTFSRTKSWNLFVYNLGAALTTGATVDIRGKAFGVWVT